MVLATSALAVGVSGDEIKKFWPGDLGDWEHFGESMAIDGARVIIGAPDNVFQFSEAGAAYTYDLSDPVNPVPLAVLEFDDGVANDHFGRGVAISGDLAIVGAPRRDAFGEDSGAAYVFDAVSGQLIMELVPDDPSPGALFGTSVDICESIVVVGAWGELGFKGAVYVFDARTGAQLGKLKAADGAAEDYFGWAVAISGSTVVVGAHFDDDNGIASGSAYVFDALTGAQLHKLTPDDGNIVEQFGFSVAIDGETAIIGALSDDDNGDSSGSAYLFDAQTGRQLDKLLPADGMQSWQFGSSVAIRGSSALVGSNFAGAGPVSHEGAAYLFDTRTGREIARLAASDGDIEDQLGTSVAIGDGIALAGAPQDDSADVDSGAVYVFDAHVECAADVNGDDELNVLDFVAFQLLWQAGDPAADCDDNAEFNVLDFVCFQQLFQAGCGS